MVSQKTGQGTGMQPVLDSVTLPLKTQVHSLAVPLDLSLSLDDQVSVVVRSAFKQLKLAHQLCPCLERSDLALIFSFNVI